ncbi:MAG TPA: hypothetical protein DCM86_16645 [Verrucomicrobiales bacterium]|nr:hypothetical protein [Verrucomicrobiales bacterium]
MFAGPNGSGKSILKSYLPAPLLGVYLNPDEIEAALRREGYLDLRALGVATTASEVLPWFTSSELLSSEGLLAAAQRLRFTDGKLMLEGVDANAYLASVAVDFLRSRFLTLRTSFTFETVMSHPGKIDLLQEAHREGYRTYLYYVATEDPAINISRVRSRVILGGHPVPEDKIITRYHRSLDLLIQAIRQTNRAYIFDNSSENPTNYTWVAEITEGRTLELKTTRVPAWFKRSVLERIG